MNVLFVCTGNICRSPMAAALLRARLAQRSVEVEVSSAGILTVGRPADPRSIASVARRGADLSGHTSRRIEPGILRTSHLLLGMTREHVREIVAVEPSAWPRAFTLREFVRRVRPVGPRRGDLDFWLSHVAAGRTLSHMLGRSPDDDIDDPIAADTSAFHELAAELDELLDTVVEHVWGATPRAAR